MPAAFALRIAFAFSLSAVRVLQELLLLGRILLEVGLQAEQQPFVDDRLDVVRLELQRVIDRRHPFANEVLLFRVLQLEVAVGLVPVVGGDGVERFGVVRFLRGALFERFDGLVEVALAVVVAGKSHVHRRIARFGRFRLHQHLFGFVIGASILVDLRQREVIRRLAGLELNHLLDDRLGLGRVVQLVGPVGRHEILERQLAELLVGGIGRRRQLFGRFLVVLDRLGQHRVVGGVALLARLVLVVEAVAEEEVGLMGRCGVGRGRDGLLVEVRRLLVVLLLIGGVGGLERLFRLNLADLGASHRRRE